MSTTRRAAPPSAAPPASRSASIELTDLGSWGGADPEPTLASVTYQLAHETALHLEARGEHCRAAELLASMLAEEALRINQRALGTIDLMTQAEHFKSVSVSMAVQQHTATQLLVPLLDERPAALLGGCLATVTQTSRRGALPRPEQALGSLAARWYLPPDVVSDAWREFVRASGGAFTLSFMRARQTILAEQPEDVAHAVWELALTDPAAAELISFDAPVAEPAMAPACAPASASAPAAAAVGTSGHGPVAPDAPAEPSAPAEPPAAVEPPSAAEPPAGLIDRAVANAVAAVAEAAAEAAADGEAFVGAEGLGGASGLSFEDYLVLRCFVCSEHLEAQFRFLWRILDRDGDGRLSRADLRAALCLQSVRLGWDEPLTGRYAQWVYDTSRRNKEGHIGPKELRATLLGSAQLRTLLMAREPLSVLRSMRSAQQPASGSAGALDAMLAPLRRLAEAR